MGEESSKKAAWNRDNATAPREGRVIGKKALKGDSNRLLLGDEDGETDLNVRVHRSLLTLPNSTFDLRRLWVTSEIPARPGAQYLYSSQVVHANAASRREHQTPA